MKKVAYYKGCLASLSAKELDFATQALAPKVGLELIQLESVTCCGAGDIHEAEPDYYLHLNARILAYGEATGAETLMTICNVCTLNLRQANWQLKNEPALLERVNRNLAAVGVPPYSGNIDVRHLLWLIAEGDGYERLKEAKFAVALARRGKVPPPGPIHVAAEVDEARALYNLVKTQGRDGALGIVQGEKALERIEFIEEEAAREQEEGEE